MARYRLIQPHGIYAVGTVLDTELPLGRPFSIELPTAKRLTELGVMEPLSLDSDGPVLPQDEPGWSQKASRAVSVQSAPERVSHSSGTGKRKG